VDASVSVDADSSRGSPRLLILIPIILLVIYPLSVPPVIKICGNTAPPAIVALYSPLEYTYHQFPIARTFFDAYFNLSGLKK
jgi:hypothetical protein